MKRRLLIMLFLAVIAGCAKTESPVVITSSSNAPLSKEQSPESIKPVNYPEKTEVERLLARAGEHQQQGEFDKALTIVKEALQVDPNSTSATAMRTNLEDILRKI